MPGLRSPRFAGLEVLEACLAGGHRILRPETGVAVQRVQQALIDLGFAIPSGATGNFLDKTKQPWCPSRSGTRLFRPIRSWDREP